jgi:hypothetical protein
VPITPPQTTATDRRVLGVALSIGIAGILMTAVPAIDFRIKRSFAERLSRHAETAAPAAARLEARELARRGVVAIPPLVRLAGSPNLDAADAARDEVSAALASWESEYRTSQNAPRLAEKLTILAKALEQWTPTYEIVGRLWADRLALQITEDCAVLSASASMTLLAHCDRVLAVALAEARQASPLTEATGSAGGLFTDLPRPTESTGGAGGFQAPVAGADSSMATLPEPAPLPIASAPAGEAELRLIDGPPVTPPAEAPRLPVTVAQPAVETLEPRIAADSEQLQSRPLPAPKPQVVDVPPPQQLRPMLRKYRQMSDGELARELAMSSGFNARTIQQVLRERNLPTAVGPAASLSRNPESDVERRILEQVSRLAPARGRQLLRDLATDAAENPEVRLQALALLATSGDPMLATIARERAISDADPRVAELATRIIREQGSAKK